MDTLKSHESPSRHYPSSIQGLPKVAHNLIQINGLKGAMTLTNMKCHKHALICIYKRRRWIFISYISLIKVVNCL